MSTEIIYRERYDITENMFPALKTDQDATVACSPLDLKKKGKRGRQGNRRREEQRARSARRRLTLDCPRAPKSESARGKLEGALLIYRYRSMENVTTM
jgi:hypothetical protein